MSPSSRLAAESKDSAYLIMPPSSLPSSPPLGPVLGAFEPLRSAAVRISRVMGAKEGEMIRLREMVMVCMGLLAVWMLFGWSQHHDLLMQESFSGVNVELQWQRAALENVALKMDSLSNSQQRVSGSLVQSNGPSATAAATSSSSSALSSSPSSSAAPCRAPLDVSSNGSFCPWSGRRKYGDDFEGPCKVCELTEQQINEALAMPGMECGAFPLNNAKHLFLNGEWMTTFDSAARFRAAPRGPPMCGMFCVTLKRAGVSTKLLIPMHMRPGSSDFDVGIQIFSYGYMDLFSQSDSFGTILDAGGNVGFATVYFSLLFPEATIVTIEPSGENFEILKKNTEHLPHVHVIHSALWSSTGPLSLLNFNPGMEHQDWAIKVKETSKVDKNDEVIGSTLGLSVKTIKEIMNIEVFDLIKIDIEGSEAEVFSGRGDGYDFIKTGKMATIELHDWIVGTSSAAVGNAFSNTGWTKNGEANEHVIYRR